MWLYDCFKHWKRTGNIWIYSDPHFGVLEMQHIRRNYIGDDEQVKRINSKVGKDDTIIFLGDIGNAEYVDKIKGYKILIMGNHDKKTEVNYHFDEIYDGPVMINSKIMLSHEPIDLPYIYSIHGHDHSNWFKSKNHLNICAEWIDYTPVSLWSLLKNGVASKVDDIHRMTIDKATENKRKKEK